MSCSCFSTWGTSFCNLTHFCTSSEPLLLPPASRWPPHRTKLPIVFVMETCPRWSNYCLSTAQCSQMSGEHRIFFGTSCDSADVIFFSVSSSGDDGACRSRSTPQSLLFLSLSVSNCFWEICLLIFAIKSCVIVWSRARIYSNLARKSQKENKYVFCGRKVWRALLISSSWCFHASTWDASPVGGGAASHHPHYDSVSYSSQSLLG